MYKVADLLKDEKVQRILRTIKNTNAEIIEPRVDFKNAVKYPIFEGTNIPPEEVTKSLLTLTEAGILNSEIVDNVAVCPHCWSHRLMIKARCPSCNSSKLVMGKMIEHMECGHIDFEDKFRSEEGLYCPSCRKPLRQLSVDYRTFSSLYRCLNCRSVFSNPNVEYICDNGHTFEGSELTFYSIMSFKVNPEKKSLLERFTFDVEVVLKPLREEGLLVKAPAVFHGDSGIKHEFSFAILQDANHPPIVVGSVHISDRAVSVTDILALWAKSKDVGARHVIMITLSGIDEGGKSLAEAYGMKIINGRDIQKAAAEVKDYVKMMLKGSLTITQT